MTTRTKSSIRFQSGLLIRSMPRSTVSPRLDCSIALVARKNTNTSAMPVQNQGLVRVAAIGCGGAPTI
jgi:hypothetical protein